MKWICLLTFLFCVSVIEKAFGQSSRSYVAGNFMLMMDTKSDGWIRKEGNTLIFKVLNASDTAELRRRNQKIINEFKLPYFIRFDVDPGFKPKGIDKGVTNSNKDTLPKVQVVNTVKHNPTVTLSGVQRIIKP